MAPLPVRSDAVEAGARVLRAFRGEAVWTVGFPLGRLEAALKLAAVEPDVLAKLVGLFRLRLVGFEQGVSRELLLRLMADPGLADLTAKL